MTLKNHKEAPEKDSLYWQKTRRMTLWLLLLWFSVTFSAIFFARHLSTYTLFGWPISFFMAAQGSILIVFGIIAFYAWRMNKLDKTYGNGTEHED